MRIFLLVFITWIMAVTLTLHTIPLTHMIINTTKPIHQHTRPTTTPIHTHQHNTTLTNTMLSNPIGCNMFNLMKNARSLQDATRWTYHNGTPVLTIQNCSLNSIDAKLARECIATNSPNGISLIGDSLTRYQYLNLAHFLATGNWTSDPLTPNEREISHASWTDFYHTTNARMQGHEICDCSREAGDTIMEHRYFEMNGVKLSYMQVFGAQQQILYHNTTMLNISSCRTGKCQQSLCKPGACTPSTAASLGYITSPGVLSSLVQTHPSDDVFINAGHWWMNNQQNSFIQHKPLVLSEANRSLNAKTTNRFHWKLTTASMAQFQPEHQFASELIRSGMFHGAYDAWTLTKTLDLKAHMWDPLHFQPAVYVGLNQALIAYICSMHTK